ncbi:MAG: DNA repair ATPase [Planctomycetes bacterium]|nr:DNA repair ATPase [Planctomycetota bacterium]
MAEENSTSQLEGGSYEILKNRLNNASGDLNTRIENLNQRRKKLFGAIEFELANTGRVTTKHNCTPRDMVPINSHFIFGYNVHIGLKTTTELEDVFGVYRYENDSFHEESLELLGNEKFLKDFADLYKFYRHTTFSRFAIRGPHLFMIFRTGKKAEDIKAFKWLISEDKLSYIGNRSENEYSFPDQHTFQWERTGRDDQRGGAFPHISIKDKIFVETVGGDLTIKIEDNTDSGQGIYAEPVEYEDQTLDDAEIYFATIGTIILLKIRPYQEKDYRYIAYCEKVSQAWRIDSLEESCILLPEDQGIVFPGGCLLQSGAIKTFEHSTDGMRLDECIRSPNGEDYLYVYYEYQQGNYLLLPYNIVDQQMDSPINCHGFSLFDDGKLALFSSEDRPGKQHILQLWQTPFTAKERDVTLDSQDNSDIYLSKLGNKDIVKTLAECKEIILLAAKDESYMGLYHEIAQNAERLLEHCFWLEREEVGKINEPLIAIREVALAAMDEYEKVRQVKEQTKQSFKNVENELKLLCAEVDSAAYTQLEDYVSKLSQLRTFKGSVIVLKDLKYADIEKVTQFEEKLNERSSRLSNGCINLLQEDSALAIYEEQIKGLEEQVSQITSSSQAKELEDQLKGNAENLELLTELVGSLKIDDPNQSTIIMEKLSAIFALLNQVKAHLKNRYDEIGQKEGEAEFAAQMNLIDQSLSSAIERADSPEKCDESLSRTMVKLEELEGRFGDFDVFIEKLADKRDAIYSAFESRKLILQEKRQKKIQALTSASERILTSVQSRLSRSENIEAIHSTFSADIMVDKARDLAEQLRALGNVVKADEIEGKLKSSKEQAIRHLRDQLELSGEGEDSIRLGRHSFSVNRQALELSLVMHNDHPHFHLSGTDYFEKVQHEELEATRAVWSQEIVSENQHVYRAEYLAYQFTKDYQNNDTAIHDLAEETLSEEIAKYISSRHDEGYVKGVHDKDAALISQSYSRIKHKLGPLSGTPSERALARVWLAANKGSTNYKKIQETSLSYHKLQATYPGSEGGQNLRKRLQADLQHYLENLDLFSHLEIPGASEYIIYLLGSGGKEHMTLETQRLLKNLVRQIDLKGEFKIPIQSNPEIAYPAIKDWARALVISEYGKVPAGGVIEEIASLALSGQHDNAKTLDTKTSLLIEGMRGAHTRLKESSLTFEYSNFIQRMHLFTQETVPAYRSYELAKKNVLNSKRSQLRLDEFKPRILSSFVRNRLIDEVYLPIIGDNLAKQMGSLGATKRTDLMGLLLLISPPGYGKTTLMEYVADRLGLTFVKINGPAIGHRVLSLDPAEAPNASSREEINKLNLSLEMGNNVMIYLDDIQHVNPEFLQKFISLCDGQRRIEGVYQGKPRTYDLRGKKVAVVMAGNPYTESGTRFQVPDMLSNRADTYNLGDILSGHGNAFEVSYLENALTSSPFLSPLGQRSRKDIHAFIKAAETDSTEHMELEGSYSNQEMQEILSVLKHLLVIRDVILKVNQRYIISAGQDDRDRTEPPFKLQGSYRNMNRMVEKVQAIMNETEVRNIILDHYVNESQTLTAGAEANILSFKALMNWLDDNEKQRYEHVLDSFRQQTNMLNIDDNDPLAPVLAQLSTLNGTISSIGKNLTLPQDKQDISFDVEAFSQALQESLSPLKNQEIKVVNKIPSVVTGVLKNQLKLIENWMKPLLKAQLTQSKDLGELRDSLATTHRSYMDLVSSINTKDKKTK